MLKKEEEFALTLIFLEDIGWLQWKVQSKGKSDVEELMSAFSLIYFMFCFCCDNTVTRAT